MYGDRFYANEFTKLLVYLSEQNGIGPGTGKKWDLVVDFCAYVRKNIKSVIRGLADKVHLYVFISTDSVYEACATEVRSGPVKESDSLRPESLKEIRRLEQLDKYGHDKLRCEEYLASHAQSASHFPYLCMRLPDVLGPYDATDRFWPYLIWLGYQEKWPIHTQRIARDNQLSFVYSEDVVEQILSYFEQVTRSEASREEFVRKVHGQSFNISCNETVCLEGLIRGIVRVINRGERDGHRRGEVRRER